MLHFCDEDMRRPLPAYDHDLLAYVGYLSLEGKISAASLHQYLSAVYQYQEFHRLESPTKTPLVPTYLRKMDVLRTTHTSKRIGCPAHLMREVFQLGCSASDQTALSSCMLVVMAFVFQLRVVSMHHVKCKDMIFNSDTPEVFFYRFRGKSSLLPKLLRYRASDYWSHIDNTLQLMLRWHFHKYPDGSFGMSLSKILQRVISVLKTTPQ